MTLSNAGTFRAERYQQHQMALRAMPWTIRDVRPEPVAEPRRGNMVVLSVAENGARLVAKGVRNA